MSGRFLGGKFELMNMNVAYSAISQAFQGFMKKILGENETNRKIWKEQFMKALGTMGQLVVII